MSNAALNYVFENSKTVGSARVLMLAIADRVNDKTNSAFPSRADLAKRVNVSLKQITELVYECERMGELWVQYQRGKGSTFYIAGMVEKPKNVRKPRAKEERKRPKSSEAGVTTTSEAGVTTSGEARIPTGSEAGVTSGSEAPVTASSEAPVTRTQYEPSGNPVNQPNEPPSPYDHLTTSEKARRSKQLAQLVIAHQDATDDNERATIRQQIESITAEIRAEVWPTTGPVIDGRGGGAAGVDSDRPGDATGVRSDRDARGLLPDQTRHDMAGHERHASARGAD